MTDEARESDTVTEQSQVRLGWRTSGPWRSMLDHLKTTLAGTHHSLKYRKYAEHCPAGFPYRFNRRFDLRALVAHLDVDVARRKPAPAKVDTEPTPRQVSNQVGFCRPSLGAAFVLPSGKNVVIVLYDNGNAIAKYSMDDATPPRLPIAHGWLPSAPWLNHIRSFMVRDTRDCHLEPNQQFIRFPAHPYCSLTWHLEGGFELISCDEQTRHFRPARCVIRGCSSSPLTFTNLGEVHIFIVMFYPEAFHAFFGTDMVSLYGRLTDARQTLPQHGVELIDAVFQAQSEYERQLAGC